MDAHELPQVHAVTQLSPDVQVASFPCGQELSGETMNVRHLLVEKIKGD